MSHESLDDLLNLSKPRFNFRKNRRSIPIIGEKLSSLNHPYILHQLMDGDASVPLFSSWFLNRYQKILPKRVTRLTRFQQRELATHTKRMRHLLLLTTQDKAFHITKPKRKKRFLKRRSKRFNSSLTRI